MSYGSFPPTPRRLGGTLVIVLAALVPLCFAGWLVWRSVDEPDPDGPTRLTPPGASASAHPGRAGDTDGENGSSGKPGDRDRADAGDGDAAKSGGAGGKKDDEKTGGSSADKPSEDKPLKGKVVVIDPGHNPRNHDHSAEIARLVDIGSTRKGCDTTGTSTDAGYAEATFTLDVAHRVRTLLEARGATVKFTHDGDRPFGPCIDERAEVGNRAKADAALSVHADGAPVGDRGFHVILPAVVRGGGVDTSAISAPSRRLGGDLVSQFTKETGSKPANYLAGGTGLDVRGDLGGLNLSTVPKVFIECGNMRDPRDAAQLTSAAWRQHAAQGMSNGLESFLKR
ncbi:N-acetylmuramoyl-L-alanine amidase [Streptomyces sp. H27-D2]|uniref:N-acetylmuramoyl-L-alanine amidase n=1 Tax=Streptomyces sp. H27-D2 TaxID=3046304 RepID=UPI002DB8CBA3|nr:N-acetylmuramoyl-L-alanine amidase [Streptomyces sp. H27-D2]MEC4017784.1 N-acetylmuramoyl-L-alanine amidase [Streptomyces sp. H27-D2]